MNSNHEPHMPSEPNLLLLTLAIILLLWVGCLTVFSYRLSMQVEDTQRGYIIIYRELQEFRDNKKTLEELINVLAMERELNDQQLKQFEERIAKLEIFP